MKRVARVSRRTGNVVVVSFALAGGRSVTMHFPRDLADHEVETVAAVLCDEVAFDRSLRRGCRCIAGPEAGLSDARKVVN